MDAGSQTQPRDPQREARIAQIVGRFMDDYAAGRVVETADYLAEQTDLLPELADRLRAARMIVDAANSLRGKSSSAYDPLAAGAAVEPTISLPGFEVIRELKRGGQGAVYLALQLSTRQKVAIKVIRSGPLARQDERERFELETRILAELQHPSIPSIHDRGSASFGEYYVMEYISGTPLDQYVRDRNLAVPDVLRLFKTVCEAVDTAHLKGIVHRDLKPPNILVADNGFPYVLDFGLARVAASDVTESGGFVGSYPWSAPEQIRGDDERIDTRTDVYALGVILYQLLTDHFPYPDADRRSEYTRHVLHDAPTPPSRHRPDIEPQLEALTLTAMRKLPEERYRLAGDLAREIGLYLGAQTPKPPAGAQVRPERRPVRVLRSLARYGAVALVTLAVVLSVYVLRGTSSPRFDFFPHLPNDDATYRQELNSNIALGVPDGLFESPKSPHNPDPYAELRRAMFSAPARLFPFAGEQQQESSQVHELVFNSLFLRLANQTLQPNPALLADEPTWADDARRCFVRLRQDAKWHDGSPVTAGDVLFSWTAQKRADSNLSTLITSVTGDATTLAFEFAEARATNPTDMNFPLVPAALYADVDLSQDERRVKQALDDTARRRPVGCGPYRLASHAPDKLVLERWDEYRGERPHFRRIVVHVDGDDAGRLRRFMAGELDALQLTDDQYDRYGKRTDASFNRAGHPVEFSQSIYNVILWNVAARPDLFGDKLVRRAMAHAFNLGQALDDCGLDPRLQVTSIYGPRHWIREPISALCRFDPDHARALLQQAGWTLTDGRLVRPDASGQPAPFRFSLKVPAASKMSQRLMQAFRTDMAAVGIEVEIQPVERAVEVLATRQFESLVAGFGSSLDPDLERKFWHPHVGLVGQVGYKNAAVADLFDLAAREPNTERRKQIYLRLQELIYDEQPVLFLYRRPARWAFSTRMRGVSFGLRGPFEFYPGIRAWWTPLGADSAPR